MRKFLPILIFLVALLGAAIYLAWTEWVATGAGGETMSGHGVAALILGAIGSLVLGGGLMALMFLSSRRGYDEAADLVQQKSDPPRNKP